MALKDRVYRQDHGIRYRTIIVLTAIAFNVIVSYVIHRFGLPLYLDTIGTVAVSAVAGMLPGVITAVISNVICSAFNTNAMYYSIISVLIAMVTARFTDNGFFKKKTGIVIYVTALTALGGFLGTVFQWLLVGGPQFHDVAEASRIMSGQNGGILYFIAGLFINLILNLIDKGVSAGLAFLALRFIPSDIKRAIRDSKWHQKPLSDEKISKNEAASGHRVLLRKMTLLLTLSAIVLAVIMSLISIKLYFDNVKAEYTDDAVKATKFAASVIDGARIDEYIRDGYDAPGYVETEKFLEGIRGSSPAVKYLYVVKITDRGCTFVFDLDSDGVEGMQPGESVGFDKAFEPYVPDLLAGRPIEPIESDETFGWLMTYYYPVWNNAGNTVAYVGADVSMAYMSTYARDFLVKTIMIFSGFCVLIIVFGLTFFRYHLVYPVGSMTSCAKDFVSSTHDQDAVEGNVKKIRALDIRTNDEIEELYKAVSKMEASMAAQMRDIRHFADATAKMQNGLIVTMADMVENRDSDTGAHVQKTAAYVRIILNGLRRKGYYLAKLTDKYMADVEMSAPLHDVGKINIPDAVLNKPGKLTDEEFEIMKTHTTAGKKILENAISTVEGENYLKEARNMAAYHHERWDGKGYPDKLHGEVIPLSARVMAVADVFDALTSPRVYKPAFPLEKALSILEEGAGTQFDPKVIEVFMEALPEVKRVLRKYNKLEV